MRYKFTASILCIVFTYNICYSQTPSIQWQKCYGGTNQEDPIQIDQTLDGGFIFAGGTLSVNGDITTNYGSSDYWVVKLDNIGSIVWQKCYGGPANDVATSFQQTADGGYIVAGHSNSFAGQVTGGHGLTDFWIIKLDPAGNLIWEKTLGGSGDDRAMSIDQTTDGGYIIAGISESNDGNVAGNHGQEDYWIVKLDALGNLLWQKCLGGSEDERATSIKQCPDGGYIVVGRAYSMDGEVMLNPGDPTPWIVKLDQFGNIIWKKSYGSGISGELAQSVSLSQDNGYFIALSVIGNGGNVTGFHGGSTDFWIIKLNAAGSLIWETSLGGSLTDGPTSINTTPDGGCIVIGSSNSVNGDVTINNGFNDAWIIKLSATGALQWQKSLGGTFQDRGFSISQTSDGGYCVAVSALSNNTGDVGVNHGQTDCWIVKLSPDPLPVKLVDFNAFSADKNVLCKWATEMEHNSHQFIIERSSNGLDFKQAGNIQAAGYSQSPIYYSFTDNDVVLTGIEYLYYRLKMVDIDGSYSYSNVATVKLKYATNIIVYPNPVTDRSSLSFTSDVKETMRLQYFNVSGAKVLDREISVTKGLNIIQLDVRLLLPGPYFIILNGKKRYHTRFIKAE